MKKALCAVLVLGWVPTLAVVTGARWFTGDPVFAQGRTPVKVTRLYTGPDGKTKVEEYEVPLKAQGQGTELSATVAVTSLQFRRTNKDYDLDWHPAPRRQYIVNLNAGVQITASDGEMRKIGAGEILLVEDTWGKGHLSKALDGKLRHCLFITLD